MEAGVSLSLPREGVHGSLISIPFAREHVSICEKNYSGGFNLPDNERLLVLFHKTFLLRARVDLGGALAWFHMWSDEAVGSTHSSDLLVSTLSDLNSSRSKDKGLPESSIIDRGVTDLFQVQFLQVRSDGSNMLVVITMDGSRFCGDWTTSGQPYLKGGSPYVFKKGVAYVGISPGQHGALYTYFKGFHALNGESSSSAGVVAGSAGFDSVSPIITDVFGSVSLGFTQTYTFPFRSDYECLYWETSVFDEKGIGVSGLGFRWIYEWVGRPDFILRSWFKDLDFHSIPTPLPPTKWSMDMMLSSNACEYHILVFVIPKFWVSDLALHAVPTLFIGGWVQESHEGILMAGLRAIRCGFSGAGTEKVESRVKSRVVGLVPTGFNELWIGLFSAKVERFSDAVHACGQERQSSDRIRSRRSRPCGFQPHRCSSFPSRCCWCLYWKRWTMWTLRGLMVQIIFRIMVNWLIGHV